MSRTYTPQELMRGGFLRHFMQVRGGHDADPTEEIEAPPASAQLPKTREIERPRIRRPGAQGTESAA